jgi:hypothetical protein
MRKTAVELQFQARQPLETKAISDLSQNEVMKRERCWLPNNIHLPLTLPSLGYCPFTDSSCLAMVSPTHGLLI